MTRMPTKKLSCGLDGGTKRGSMRPPTVSHYSQERSDTSHDTQVTQEARWGNQKQAARGPRIERPQPLDHAVLVTQCIAWDMQKGAKQIEPKQWHTAVKQDESASTLP
jgi:hypothetical protein